jgi:hypothetical protein
MIRLFTSAFETEDAQRRSEYRLSLERNLANPFIAEVCLLVEGNVADLPHSSKIRTRHIEGRPRYDDVFAWINKTAAVDDISLIANADIWTDSSIGVLEDSLDRDECYALARWEGEHVLDRNDSQDVWAFRGRVRNVRGDYPIGVPRCDNRILYELQESGYNVRNPSYSIRVHHAHEGSREEYGASGSNFVEPPYRYLWPHNLWSGAHIIGYNLRHRDRPLSWRFDRRRAMATFPMRIASGVIRRVARLTSSESNAS